MKNLNKLKNLLVSIQSEKSSLEKMVLSLEHLDAEARYLAAITIGKIARKKSSQTSGESPFNDLQIQTKLLRVLEDKHWYIRRAAAQVLGNFPRIHPRTQKGLLQALRDKKFAVRCAIVRTLGKNTPLNAEIRRSLVRSLKDQNWRVRRLAARSLAKISLCSPLVQKALVRALKDEESCVGISAARALGRVCPQSSWIHDKLFYCVQSSRASGFVREAAEVLHKISKVAPHLFSHWVTQLKSRKASVSFAAAYILKTKPPSGFVDSMLAQSDLINSIAALLGDANVTLRAEVATILHNFKPNDPEIRKGLFTCLTHSDPQVRLEAAGNQSESYAQSSQAVDVLVLLLKQSDAEIRERALEYLSIDDSGLTGLSSKDPKIQELLIHLLNDMSLHIRNYVSFILGRQIQNLTPENLKTLLTLATDSNYSLDAVLLLGEYNSSDPRTHEALIKLSQIKNSFDSKLALEALGGIYPRTPSVEKALLRALDDPSQYATASEAWAQSQIENRGSQGISSLLNHSNSAIRDGLARRLCFGERRWRDFSAISRENLNPRVKSKYKMSEDEVYHAVIQLLRDSDDQVRESAIEAASNLTWNAEKVRLDLSERLHHINVIFAQSLGTCSQRSRNTIITRLKEAYRTSPLKLRVFRYLTKAKKGHLSLREISKLVKAIDLSFQIRGISHEI